jgi:uncharacterized protein YndB with AHSA1/START domain
VTGNPGVVIDATLHSIGDVGVVRLKVRYETGINELWSALTTPQRLAHWYGTVNGDLRAGGEYTALISISGWDGRGRIEMCDPPRQFRVVMWEEEGKEQVVTVALSTSADHTLLDVEVKGVSLDLIWAYGIGWHMHADNLGIHLAGQECPKSDTRWNDLEPAYRQMTVERLDDV